MTYKEAIETIESNRPTAGYTMLQEALDMAIQALEKQIPQKPNPPTDKYHADTCAVCGGEVVTEQRFCGNCGQAIDWDGEDE